MNTIYFQQDIWKSPFTHPWLIRYLIFVYFEILFVSWKCRDESQQRNEKRSFFAIIKGDDLCLEGFFFYFVLRSEQLVLILLFLLIRVKPSSLLVQMGKNWYFGDHMILWNIGFHLQKPSKDFWGPTKIMVCLYVTRFSISFGYVLNKNKTFPNHWKYINFIYPSTR